jgi:hypothetical protein
LESHHDGPNQTNEEMEARRVFLEAKPVAVIWLIAMPFNGMVTIKGSANGRRDVPANRRNYGWADRFFVAG